MGSQLLFADMDRKSHSHADAILSDLNFKACLSLKHLLINKEKAIIEI